MCNGNRCSPDCFRSKVISTAVSFHDFNNIWMIGFHIGDLKFLLFIFLTIVSFPCDRRIKASSIMWHHAFILLYAIKISDMRQIIFAHIESKGIGLILIRNRNRISTCLLWNKVKGTVLMLLYGAFIFLYAYLII